MISVRPMFKQEHTPTRLLRVIVAKFDGENRNSTISSMHIQTIWTTDRVQWSVWLWCWLRIHFFAVHYHSLSKKIRMFNVCTLFYSGLARMNFAMLFQPNINHYNLGLIWMPNWNWLRWPLFVCAPRKQPKYVFKTHMKFIDLKCVRIFQFHATAM